MSLWFCSNMYDKPLFICVLRDFVIKLRGQMGTWRWPSGSECPGATGRATSRQILVSFEGTPCHRGNSVRPSESALGLVCSGGGCITIDASVPWSGGGPSSHSQAGRTPAERSRKSSGGSARPCGRRAVAPGAGCLPKPLANCMRATGML